MIKEGDYAGISAFQGDYGMIALTKKEKNYYIVMSSKDNLEQEKYKLYFKMEHFTGCRFGLVLYATQYIGKKAGFENFVYE